jgi:hypothetical protein
MRVICEPQNRLRICGKYLNIFVDYAERIYASMENMQRDSWRILLIRTRDMKVCISQLIITQIYKFC